MYVVAITLDQSIRFIRYSHHPAGRYAEICISKPWTVTQEFFMFLFSLKSVILYHPFFQYKSTTHNAFLSSKPYTPPSSNIPPGMCHALVVMLIDVGSKPLSMRTTALGLGQASRSCNRIGITRRTRTRVWNHSRRQQTLSRGDYIACPLHYEHLELPRRGRDCRGRPRKRVRQRRLGHAPR